MNLVIAFDENFYRQSVIAIKSLLKVSEINSRYNLYCIVDNINRDIEVDFCEQINCVYNQININFIRPKIEQNFYVSRGITKASYYRLFLHRFLDVDKVLYFDVDVVFKDSIKELYETDINDYVIAAVKDPFINHPDIWNEHKHNCTYWSNYFKDNYRTSYFNAGLLLLNLKKMRELDIDNYISNLCLLSFKFHDQDILNILAIEKFKKVLYLNAKYNVFAIDIQKVYRATSFSDIFSLQEMSEIENRPAMIHYVGTKPWDDPKIYMASLWWKAAKDTIYFKYFIKRLPFKIRPTITYNILNFIYLFMPRILRNINI